MAKNRIVESGRWPGSETAFEEAEAAGDDPLDPANQDPADLLTREQKVALLAKQGTVTPAQADALITDAAPRSLYVSRKLLNGAEFIKWAKGQGFATTVPADELHVTVLFSRTPVDWMKMGSGGIRTRTASSRSRPAVLAWSRSSATRARSCCCSHHRRCRGGTRTWSQRGSHDFDEYQPHVTITYEGSDLDLSKVEPYRGELCSGRRFSPRSSTIGSRGCLQTGVSCARRMRPRYRPRARRRCGLGMGKEAARCRLEPFLQHSD
jgi:hypothetical protein